jgi:hypothetical protein
VCVYAEGSRPDNLVEEKRNAEAIKCRDLLKRSWKLAESQMSPESSQTSHQPVLPPSFVVLLPGQLLEMCKSTPNTHSQGIELLPMTPFYKHPIPFPCQAACKCHEILIRVSTNSLKFNLARAILSEITVPHQIAVQIWTPEDRYHMYVA